MAFPTFTYCKNETSEQEIALLPGTTVRTVLDQDGVNPSKVEVRLNGEVITNYDWELEDGDTVAISPRHLSNGSGI